MIIASTDPSVEYGKQPTQLIRAAGHALQRLAEDGLLERTLQQVSQLKACAPQGHAQPKLEQALGTEFVRSLEATTGFRSDELREPVLEQLEKVAAFAQSDGGAAGDNFRAAEYLIRSGRVSLFSR
jgi:hypothetical protein